MNVPPTAAPDLRQHLGIAGLPISEWGGGSLSTTTGPRSPGIHTPYLYVTGTDGPTPFALHVEDSYLCSLNYLHAGAPKFWVVIHPHDAERLEKRLLDAHYAPPPGDACSQFVRHMSAWVPVELLDHWDLRYTTVEQQPGDLVVTAPGAYHQGCNSGWNVAEAVNYGDGMGDARALDYRHCRDECPPADQDPLQIRWRDVVERPKFAEISGWDVPRDALPLGADNKPLAVEKQLLLGKGPLMPEQVSGHSRCRGVRFCFR